MNLSKDKKIQLLLSLFFLAIFLLLPGRSLLQYGMFIDGIFYSNLARDFSQGESTWWVLEISQGTDQGAFYSHPPLALWLQAGLYWLLGDQFWVDRLYGLLCLLISVFLAIKILQLFRLSSSVSFWLLIFYLAIPQVSWAFSNNLLENSLNVFALLAVYGHLQTMLHRRWLWGLIAIAATFAATLAKGPPGLFPLAVPLLIQLSMRPMQWGWALAWGLGQLLGFVGIWAMLLYSAEGASLYFNQYLQIQLQPSLTGQLQVADHRLSLLLELLWQLWPLAALVVVFWALAPKKQPVNKAVVLLLAGIGLSASLPLLISPKQMGFYILPSLIYFAMAAVVLAEHNLSVIQNKLIQKNYEFIAFISSFLLIVLGSLLIINNYKTYHRDAEVLQDIQAIQTKIIPAEKIGVSKNLYEDWSLFAYLYQNYKMNIALAPGETRCFIVNSGDPPPTGYTKTLYNGKVYDFYCKD